MMRFSLPVWLLAGFGLDVLGMVPAALLMSLPVPEKADPIFGLWALSVLLMATTWTMHVALLPILLGGTPRLPLSGFAASLVSFLMIAGTVLPIAGVGAFLLFVPGPPAIRSLVLVATASGVGALGGALLNMTQPRPSGCVSLARRPSCADALGGAMMLGLFALTIEHRAQLWMPPTGDLVLGFVLTPKTLDLLTTPFICADYLFPHLLLLGRDLRRASHPTYPRKSPAAPSTPPR